MDCKCSEAAANKDMQRLRKTWTKNIRHHVLGTTITRLAFVLFAARKKMNAFFVISFTFKII